MADLKISALTASTTPLTGTEVLPIVQSSTTKQVSVANLTAGRAISATQLTLTTGNVIVANGQGIDFSATTGTGTSELLNDYEEGTWTPVIGGDGGESGQTYVSTYGFYVKVGRQVTLTWQVKVSVKGTISGTYVQIKGFPFTSRADGSSSGAIGFFASLATPYSTVSLYIDPSVTYAYVTGTTVAATTIAYLAPANIANNTTFTGSLTYFV
jgi:hypothetical protein